MKEVFTIASPPVLPVSLFVPTVAATASEKDSTAAFITITTVVTPYTRRRRASRGVVMTSSSPIPINKEDKSKGIMTEPAKPTKQKVQEQISEHLARELEEEFTQENQRLKEQAARDAEIARLHTEGELKMMINELDRNNEDKIELIIELAKYQKDLAQIKKYQAQRSKLASKTDRRKFYTSVLRSHAKWKTKDVKGMTFEQIEETFIPVWESIQDFVPMDSKLEISQAPKAYPYFEAMLKEYERDDMVTLWKVVKDRVHYLIMEGMIIYMLDDVEYPLPKTTLQKMLDHKCEVSEFDDDLIQMINLIKE
ncbi:hypothetical protein Tco_0226229 [Tanacetum coccineum]